jgi:hypothetical protein
LGYREVNGKLIRDTGFDTTSRFERTIARFAPRLELNANNRSTEQSTKVKEYIRELFPKIPEEDLEEIYKRAWEQVRVLESLYIEHTNQLSSGHHNCR